MLHHVTPQSRAAAQPGWSLTTIPPLALLSLLVLIPPWVRRGRLLPMWPCQDGTQAGSPPGVCLLLDLEAAEKQRGPDMGVEGWDGTILPPLGFKAWC